MDYQKFDNQFHQRLYHAEVPPPPAVWANVEEILRQRRRKRAFAWIFGGSLAGASVCAALWLFNQPAENATATGTLAETSATAVGRQPSAAATAPTVAEGIAEAPSTIIRPPSTVSRQPSTVSAKSGARHSAGAAQKLGGQFVQQPGVTDNQPVAYEKIAAETGVLVAHNMSNKAADLALLATRQPLVASEGVEPPYRFAPIKPLWRKKKDAKHCYSFANHRAVWLLDGYTGFARPARTFSDVQPGFDNYAAQRDQTERSGFGMTGGLRGSLVWGPLVLRTGLHYTQFTEVFENEHINSIRTIIVIDSTLVNGQWVKTEKTVREFGSKFSRSYNRFGMLDVPLLVGAEMRFGRGGVSLNGGGAVNILFWKRGSVLAPGNQVDTPFGSTALEPFFKANTGFSLVGSAQGFWHVSPRTRVFVEPYFQRIVKPVTVGSYPLAQRYNILGVNMGVTRIIE